MSAQGEARGNQQRASQRASALLLQAATQDISLEQPDMVQKRQQRLDRTRATMKENTLTDEEKAAVRIQSQFRGHMGRKRYTELLYSQFEKDEAMRLQKTMEQVEEGELLVENHRLQVQFDDNTTTRRNRSRQYLTHVVTIQRAWRAYKRRRHLQSGQCNANDNMSPQTSSEADDVSETDSSNGAQAMSVSTSGGGSEKNLNLDGEDSDVADAACFEPPGGATAFSLLARKHVIEPDPDSVASDYSEMAGPIKEHLANVQIIQREDLQTGNTMFANQFTVQQRISRGVDETEEEFSKRLRKINYLSLAQEFAELKKIDSSALPFDLHKGKALYDASPMSDMSSETDSDKYNPDSALTTPMETQKEFAPEKANHILQDNLSRKMEDVSILGEAPVLLPGELQKQQQQAETKKKMVEGVNGVRIPSDGIPQQASDKHSARGPGQRYDTKIAGTRKNKDMYSSPSSSPAKNAPLSRSMSEGTKSSSSVLEKGIQDSTIPEAGRNKSESVDDLHDFDVYNIETTLPQMDWAMLEQQLQMAAQEEKEKKKSRHNDREEIRRRLAMGTDEDYYGGERAYKKPNLQTRLQSGMNLQICFVNESTLDADLANVGKVTAATEVDNMKSGAALSTSLPQQAPTTATRTEGFQKHVSSSSKPTSSSKGVPDDEEALDFPSRQAKLQAEARMALASVRPMAHMQLEVEKQMRKKSPIAEIVGIPGIGDGKRMKFELSRLNEMNLAQLQVVVNDLHSQIESLNEDLVHLLIDRDDLHMEQDSMLVDIEDHTRRAQDISVKMQTKTKKPKDRERDRKK